MRPSELAPEKPEKIWGEIGKPWKTDYTHNVVNWFDFDLPDIYKDVKYDKDSASCKMRSYMQNYFQNVIRVSAIILYTSVILCGN